MININVHNILRANAQELSHSSALDLFTTASPSAPAITLYLPAGTAAAVAACINVAVAAGAQAAAMEAAQ